VADRVDAAVNAMQPSLGDADVDHTVAVLQRAELGERNDTVLTAREQREAFVV
jgi:hypothetical protein